jgi:delta8-fatty-acid desaturase
MCDARVLDRAQIKALIAQGQLIVISDGLVLRLDQWIDRHPGGRLPILHMVGKDATDQILVLSFPSSNGSFIKGKCRQLADIMLTHIHCSYHSPEVLKQMRGYRIGVINEPWIDFEPPISGGTFDLGVEKEDSQAAPTSNAVQLQLPVVAAGGHLQDGNRAMNCSKGCPNGTQQCLSAESMQFVQSIDCDEAFLTNKKQWFADMSSVSDTLKHCSSKYDAAQFIDHATKLAVDVDLSEYPSLDAETQRNISVNFRKLHEKVRQSGLNECDLSNYGMEIVRYVILFSLFILALRYEWYITSAVFLGLFWHQIMFVAHDAGHLAITHNFNIDMMIGIFIADFCCGLSIGWWKSSHNVHHLVPNHPVCVVCSIIA